jgi:hypothetical protein
MALQDLPIGAIVRVVAQIKLATQGCQQSGEVDRSARSALRVGDTIEALPQALSLYPVARTKNALAVVKGKPTIS